MQVKERQVRERLLGEAAEKSSVRICRLTLGLSVLWVNLGSLLGFVGLWVDGVCESRPLGTPGFILSRQGTTPGSTRWVWKEGLDPMLPRQIFSAQKLAVVAVDCRKGENLLMILQQHPSDNWLSLCETV